MKSSDIKVFHGLVNYGTQAGMFAKGLRDRGLKAYSVSLEDNYSRLIDEQLTYSNSWVVRRFEVFEYFIKKIKWFFHYNVFHFYFGKSFLPYNLDLYLYRLFGKKVVMEYLGTDCDLWLGLNGVDWRERPVDRVKLVKRVYKQAKLVDKQLVCAPCYYQFVDNSVILPLALDLSSYQYQPFIKHDRLVFMHCPTNSKAKKSDYIEAALDRLKKKGYDFEYKCITNVTHEQLKEEYCSSDVVIDQLNHWYGTVSVEAMALGKPVVCGYQPHLCHYDSRYENMPIINASIYDIYAVLKDILDGKYNLEDISQKSREFAVKTHDLKAVTQQLINIYETL